MKKFILISSLFIGVCLSCYASPLVVKNIEELRNDLSARTISRVDVNNKPCALIRINLPTMDELRFSDAVVGEVSYMPGEYIIYVSPDATTLSYACKGERTTINFSDFGINIEGKKSYRITLGKEEQTTTKNATSAYISANYDNMIVLVDGIPMGETPLTIESIEPGRHTISVPNTSGYTMNDTIVDIFRGEKNIIMLSLYKKNISLVGVKYYQEEGNNPEFFWGIKKTKENKAGIEDYTGKVLVPFEYDSVTYDCFWGDCCIIERDGKYGVYKRGEKEVVSCMYEDYFISEKNHFIALRKDGKWGILNSDFEEKVPFKYETIEYENYILDKRVSHLIQGYNLNYLRMYYTDDKGQLHIEECNYNGKKLREISEIVDNDQYGRFNEGYWLFRGKLGHGILELNGVKRYLPEKYSIERSAYVSMGLFPVYDKTTHKYGYMNTKLEWVVEPFYKPLTLDYMPNYFNSGFSLAGNEQNKEVILDRRGNEASIGDYRITALIGKDGKGYYGSFDFIERCQRKDIDVMCIRVSDNNGKEGIFDLDGKQIIPCEIYYKIEIFEFNDGLCFFCLSKGMCDIIDMKGNLVKKLPMGDFDHISFYKHGNDICYVRCRKKTPVKIQLLDKELNVLVDFPENMGITYTSDGIFKVFETDRCVEDYYDGYYRNIVFHRDGLFGYVNIKGELLANCIYRSFDEKVNEEMTDVLPYDEWPLYDALRDENCSEGLAILNIGDRYGFIDNTGKVVVPLMYTGVTPFENGISYVRDQEGNWSKIYRKDL